MSLRSEMRNAHIFPRIEWKRIRTANPTQTLYTIWNTVTFNIILQTCSWVSPAELLAHTVVAHLVDLAVLVVEADVLAELPVADLSLGALGVAGAGGGLAHATHHGGGVGDEGGRAGALRTMVHNLARGIRPACVPDAWIHTPDKYRIVNW